MKRILTIIAIILLRVLAVSAADEVMPVTSSVTNLRDEAVVYLNKVSFFEGTTLRLTNCVAYSGSTTSSAVQGLDGVTINLRVGNTTSNILYSGTVISTNLGTWWADVTVPTNLTTPVLQVELVDSIATNSYIYPWKNLRTADALQ